MARIYHWYEGEGGRFGIRLRREDLDAVPRQGAADESIAWLRKVPRLAKQLAKIDADTLRLVLKGYGAWEADALADHEANLDRILWIAVCDVRDEPSRY